MAAAIGVNECLIPAVTLTVLLLTHLESGSFSALRMARALPAGNLGMLAFLASFRVSCPVLGLLWGTILSYVATLAMLTLVFFVNRPTEEQMVAAVRRSAEKRSVV